MEFRMAEDLVNQQTLCQEKQMEERNWEEEFHEIEQSYCLMSE